MLRLHDLQTNILWSVLASSSAFCVSCMDLSCSTKCPVLLPYERITCIVMGRTCKGVAMCIHRDVNHTNEERFCINARKWKGCSDMARLVLRNYGKQISTTGYYVLSNHVEFISTVLAVGWESEFSWISNASLTAELSLFVFTVKLSECTLNKFSCHRVLFSCFCDSS
jgi:hypothetical protein